MKVVKQLLSLAGLGLLLAGAFLAAGAEPPAESADARFNRAERLLAAGELEKAYELYESLAKSAPARWAARAGPRLEEIKKLVESRDGAHARAAKLREAAGVAQPGELAPWLLLESARGLFEARLAAEAAADAAALIAKFPESRFKPAAQLLLARADARLEKPDEAVANYRAVLACKGASRPERADAWKELAELLAGGGKAGELRELLRQQVERGPEEPGAPEAAERLLAVSLTGPPEAAEAAKALGPVIENWPANAVRPEWVLTAGKLAEFIERDYARAEKLYRLVLERYPEASFDLQLLAAGRPKADAGRDVILGALARVAEKRAGRLAELKAPEPAERGKTAEKALAAVLVALRAGDAEAARSASTGALAADAAAGRCEFARFGLSDFRVLGVRKETAAGAEIEYEVSGELGVTRVLKKTARAVREGGAWKIADLGL